MCYICTRKQVHTMPVHTGLGSKTVLVYGVMVTLLILVQSF
jgi:hypothetical protein